ncbi:MAG: endonuclease V [archaeon]
MFEKYEKIQKELAKLLILKDKFEKIEKVAGVDQAFLGNYVLSEAVVVSFSNFEILERKWALKQTDFPYIPGLLCFREGDVAVEALKKLENKPDIVFVDGSGIAHPRKFGLACYVGLKTGLPTIGVTKSHLVGKYDEKSDVSKLTLGNSQVGWVLNKGKVFISPGYKVSIKSCLDITKKSMIKNYPEPLLIAHKYAKKDLASMFPNY